MSIIKIENPTNAFVVISSDEGKILIDPWLEDGIYEGTWHNFPRVSDLYQEKILDSVTSCLITHLHKDHFNIQTLNKLPKNTKFIFPETFGWRVIESNLHSMGFCNTHLLNLSDDIIVSAGFKIKAIPPLNTDGLESVIENPLAIDGGFVLESIKSNLKLIFLADNNLYNNKIVEKNIDLLKNPDLIAFAYSGFASDYPFNYDFDFEEKVKICSENEEVRFSKQVNNLLKINPKFILPYSSEFVPVDGNFESWNSVFRKVYTSDKNLVAKRYGDALGCNYGTLYPREFLLFNKKVMMPIKETYNRKHLLDEMFSYQKNFQNIKHNNLVSNENIVDQDINIKNMKNIFKEASENCFKAIEKNNLSPHSSINLFINNQFFFSLDFKSMKINSTEDTSEPFLNIFTDLNMMFKLLTGKLHWDDGALSMKINWARRPNIFDFDTYNALTYLRVPFSTT